MKKYAVFLSLTDNYAYLFNALLNSIELFGVGVYADVVVIHDASVSDEYQKFILEKAKSMETNVIFIPVISLPEDKDLNKVLTVKYYRYKIMAEYGPRYESICFIDTDIFLASGILEYFKIAANTDLIVGVNDNVIRQYRNDPKRGTCPSWAKDKKPFFDSELWDGKFICNTPLFIDPSKYGHVLQDVFRHKSQLGMDNTWPFTGDLETMNLVFNKHRMKNNMLVLASHLWTNVHYSIYRTSLLVKHMTLGDHIKMADEVSFRNKFLFMSETQEHVRAFHGRDWTNEKNENRIKTHNIPKLLTQMEGNYDNSSARKRIAVFELVQAYFLYLQYNCYISLDDLKSIIPIRDINYLQKKREQLSSQISKFGNIKRA